MKVTLYPKESLESHIHWFWGHSTPARAGPVCVECATLGARGRAQGRGETGGGCQVGAASERETGGVQGVGCERETGGVQGAGCERETGARGKVRDARPVGCKGQGARLR
jgi:hypothetical protein